MALSEEARLLVKISAQNATNAAFGQLNNNLDSLKSAALKVGAALAGALALRDVIETTKAWGDSVDKLQDVTGLTATQASRLAFAAQALGVGTDELTTGFDRLAKNMFSTSVEADKGKDAFNKWGIAIRDSGGSIRNVNDIFVDAAARVQQLGDSAASRALELDLFGRSGGRLHDLLMRGADGVRELMRQSDELGLTINGQTLAAIKDFELRSNILGLALNGLKITLGNLLLPLLTGFVMLVTRVIAGIRSWAQNSRLLAGFLKAVGEAVRFVLGLVKSFIDRIAAFADAIGSKGFVKALLDLLEGLKNDFVAAMSRVGEAIDAIFGKGTLASEVVKGLGVALLLLGGALVVAKIIEVAGAVAKIALQATPLALVAASLLLIYQSTKDVGLAAFADFTGAVILAVAAITLQFLPQIRLAAAALAGIPAIAALSSAATALLIAAIPFAVAAAIGAALGLILYTFGPQLLAGLGELKNAIGRKFEQSIAEARTNWAVLTIDIKGMFDTLGTWIHDSLEATGRNMQSWLADRRKNWDDAVHSIGALFDGLGTTIHDSLGAIGTNMQSWLADRRKDWDDGVRAFGGYFDDLGTAIHNALAAIHIDLGWVTIDGMSGIQFHIPTPTISLNINWPSPPDWWSQLFGGGGGSTTTSGTGPPGAAECGVVTPAAVAIVDGSPACGPRSIVVDDEHRGMANALAAALGLLGMGQQPVAV